MGSYDFDFRRFLWWKKDDSSRCLRCIQSCARRGIYNPAVSHRVLSVPYFFSQIIHDRMTSDPILFSSKTFLIGDPGMSCSLLAVNLASGREKLGVFKV